MSKTKNAARCTPLGRGVDADNNHCNLRPFLLPLGSRQIGARPRCLLRQPSEDNARPESGCFAAAARRRTMAATLGFTMAQAENLAAVRLLGVIKTGFARPENRDHEPHNENWQPPSSLHRSLDIHGY